jgi:hypothetical protein
MFVVLRHIGSIRGVTAHEDQYIATAGNDGRVILWDKATGKSVSGLRSHPRAILPAAAWPIRTRRATNDCWKRVALHKALTVGVEQPAALPGPRLRRSRCRVRRASRWPQAFVASDRSRVAL